MAQRRVDVVLAIFVVFGRMLGHTFPSGPSNGALRLTLLSLTFLAFFFEIAYVSRLASVLTVPQKARQINTLEELVDSDLEIYTLFRFKKMLNRTLRDPIRHKLLNKLKLHEEDRQTAELMKHRNIAVICKEHVALYVVEHPSNFLESGRVYRIMKQKPMPSIVCYGVRYGSPLLHKLNVLISRLYESGMPDQWRQMALWNISVAGRKYKGGKRPRGGLIDLGKSNVFSVLFGGWCLGTLVCCLEVWVWDVCKSRCNSRFKRLVQVCYGVE